MALFKSKLALIVVAVLLLGGGASYFLFIGKKTVVEAKKKGHHKQAEEGEDQSGEAHASEEHGHDEEAREAKKNDEEDDEEEDDDEEASEGGHDGHGGSKGPVIEPFIANLADPGSRRYVRLNLKLELRKPAENEPRLVERMPQVRDSVLLLLSSKTSEQLLSPEGKTALRAELVAMINKTLKKKKHKKAVRNLYFTEFLIQ